MTAESSARTAPITAESLPPEAVASQPRASMKSKSMRSRSNSAVSQPIRLGLSPFSNASKVPSMLESKAPTVPNVATDMMTSSMNTPRMPVKGGKLLNAINAHTASLKALLKLRNKSLH